METIVIIPPRAGVAGYRYFKITWTSNWGAGLVGMSVLWICDGSGAKYNTESMVHTYSGSQINGTPQEMSNTNEGDYWQLQPDYPSWWKVDMGSANAKECEILKIRSFYEDATRCFKDFTLHGSNNDSNWDLLFTGQTILDTYLQTFQL